MGQRAEQAKEREEEMSQAWDAIKQHPERYQPGAPGAHDNAVTNGLLFAQNELLERIAKALEMRPVVLVMNVPERIIQEPRLMEQIAEAVKSMWPREEDTDGQQTSGTEADTRGETGKVAGEEDCG